MRVIGGPNPIRKRYGLSLRQSIQWRIFKDQVKGEIMARVRAADRDTIQDALRLAQDFSSGKISLKELGRKPWPNHPYSRVRPNAVFNPGIINRQTGKFYTGWKIVNTSPDAPPAIWNTARVGRFLEFGTKRMVARPIDKLIIAALEPIRIRNLGKAFADGTFIVRPNAATMLRPAAS